jgi:hypothetical protein
VLCRLRWDPRTRAYADRRTTEGMSKKEIMRCLKRYLAREIYTALLDSQLLSAALSEDVRVTAAAGVGDG